MVQAAERYVTEDEYLASEERSARKHEYFNGKIYAMAGTTESHNLIAGNVYRELSTQFKNMNCRAYISDMSVKVDETGLYTYPDVSAVCGEAHFTNANRTNLVNPVVIVEVLSPSTEGYDRGDKFAHYRTLASLTDYVLIVQDKIRIEHFVRQSDDRWLLTVVSAPNDTLEIASLNCTLLVSDVYEKVDFPAVILHADTPDHDPLLPQ